MKRATVRKRCAECRGWFRPEARLAKQQRVCGEACRLARRRRQSRARRALEPVRHREEERERKRLSREAKRAAATRSETAAAVSHEPGVSPKPRKSREEFDRVWDEVIDLSRAAWEREMRRITRKIWRELRHDVGQGAVRSRAG